MHTSESIAAIAPAFLKAQQAITFAVKDAVNPHLKSKYADLPAVIDAIKEALNKNGISYLQTPGKMAGSAVLTMTTTLLHESGEWIKEEMEMPIVKTDPQGYGSALTYARRYALAAITGLYQDDDDANNATNRKKKETISGTDGAFEKLTPEDQYKLVGVKDEIEAAISNQDPAHAYKLAEQFNTEEGHDKAIALWGMLNSKTRSAIKAEGKKHKPA